MAAITETLNDKKSLSERINFKVCGLPFHIFVPFFIVIIAATYMGFMPTAKIYSNEAGSLVATTYIGTVAYLMAIGGLFFWLGDTIPFVNNYLGGACLLPLLGASFLNYVGLVPEELVSGVNVLMGGGFQDAYVSMLLVGSILIMDRKLLLSATARYMPVIIGSQAFALSAVALGGLITGTNIVDALFYIGAPIMSGGSGGAIVTLPALYSNVSGTDMSGMAGQFLSYASISNVVAIVAAAVFGGITAKMKGLNGNGDILVSKEEKVITEDEKRPGTSADYVALGSGIFMSFVFYLGGNILANLPVLGVIPGLAWTIILAIIVKAAGLFPNHIADNAVYSMNFALRALLPMLIAGIGIRSLKFTDLTEFFSINAFIIIVLGVIGAFIGAALFAKLFGLWPYEAGVTAGLCCCNIGGSGDLAVLSAANRMNLLAFASISTRIGGALMVIWIGLLYPMFI